jgi:hypothetical protein
VHDQNWHGGIDNRSNWRKVPEGFVRHLVNLDPLPGGTLGLRARFKQVAAGESIRGAVGFRGEIVYIDGVNLTAFDAATGSARVLAEAAGAGRFCAAVLNNELFLCTENETLRYDGVRVRPWGVPTVTRQPTPSVTTGGLRAGDYQYAMTYLVDGDEGGTCESGLISVTEGSGLVFVLPANAQLYVGAGFAGELYLQQSGEGSYTVTSVRDDSARLATQFMSAPAVAELMDAGNGMILQACGKVLWHTAPLRPHLRSPMRAFYQYPAAITLIAWVAGGAYVCADKTYFLSGFGTDTPNQRVLLPYGAVAGSMTHLPDGRAAWMTAYGMAIGDALGGITLPSQENFAPEQADSGASGLLNHNGNQLVVTTLKGARQDNCLAATDYYEGEVITP